MNQREQMAWYKASLEDLGTTRWYVPDPDWVRLATSYLRDRQLFSTTADQNLETYMNTLNRAEQELLTGLPPAYRSRGVWYTFGRLQDGHRVLHQTTEQHCSCAHFYRVTTTREQMCHHIQQVRVLTLALAWIQTFQKQDRQT